MDLIIEVIKYIVKIYVLVKNKRLNKCSRKSMEIVMYIILKKFICILIPISIIFTSCSHTPEITKPTNGDESDWLAYYEDQFKAFGGDVEAPSDDVSEAQKQAYIEAEDSYQSAQTVKLIVGVAALAIGLGLFIVTLGQVDQLD